MPAWRMGPVFPKALLNQFRRYRLSDIFSGTNRSTGSKDDSVKNLCCVKPDTMSGEPMLISNLISEVRSVLKAEQFDVHRLKKLTQFLNYKVAISVLQSLSKSSEDPRVCFRFFVWTSGKPQFRIHGSFSLMVDMLVEDNNRDSCDLYWSVLNEFKEKNLRVSSDAFLVLMLGYRKLKKLEKVVETFDKMKDHERKPNLDAYNVLLSVLVTKDSILLALAVYTMMRKVNIKMNSRTYNILLNGLWKDSRTDDAVTLFDEMTSRGISPDVITYTVVISGLCKADKPLEALRIFNSMDRSGCTPDSATFNALLDGFCKSADIDKALMLLKSTKRGIHDLGLRGLSCLVDGLIRAKRLSKAEEYFKGAVDAGLEPDLILYTIMMRGLCNAGRIREATEILRDMVDKGVTPDTQCFNTLIKGFCDQGLLDQAKSLVLEISQHNEFPSIYTHTILICGLCRNGLVGDALQIFADMEKIGCPPSAVTFNALIDGLCKVGELKKAQSTFHRMEIVPSVFLRLSQRPQPVLDSASLQKMVEEMVSAGLIFKAHMLLLKLSSGVAPNTYTYNILINGMCKAGNLDSALGIFKDLQLKRCVPDSVTYATLINGLLRTKRVEDAYKLFEQMNKAGYQAKSDVFVTFMTWCCRRKKLSVAFDFWLKYLRTLPRRDDEALKLVDEFFKKGDIEKAFRSLLETETKFIDFDPGPCNIFLIGLCQGHMVEEAIKAFSVLEEFKVTVSAPGCAKLIHALCFKGKLKDAVDVFYYSLEKGYRLMPRACNDLIRGLLRSNDHAMVALELVDRMVSEGYDMNSCVGFRTRTYESNVKRIEYASEG